MKTVDQDICLVKENTRYILKFKNGGLNWTVCWHPEFDGNLDRYRNDVRVEVIEEEIDRPGLTHNLIKMTFPKPWSFEENCKMVYLK